MEETWNEKASNILKSILTRRNVRYYELAIKLKEMGIDVRVILPKHKNIDESAFPMRYKNLKFSCPISQGFVDGEIVESEYNGITVYLVEKDEYYYRDYLYSTPDGDYLDNAERFIFFSKSIFNNLNLMYKKLKILTLFYFFLVYKNI